MNKTIESTRKKYPISSDSTELLASGFEKCLFLTKAHIISTNKLDRNMFFIRSGPTRPYVLTNGKKTTTWFSKEGNWTHGSLNFLKNKVGFEYVQTLKGAMTYPISIDTLNNSFQTNAELASWVRIAHQEAFLLLQGLHIEKPTLTAKERYKGSLKDFPDLHNGVDLDYISSYLGITLLTLNKVWAEYQQHATLIYHKFFPIYPSYSYLKQQCLHFNNKNTQEYS